MLADGSVTPPIMVLPLQGATNQNAISNILKQGRNRAAGRGIWAAHQAGMAGTTPLAHGHCHDCNPFAEEWA